MREVRTADFGSGAATDELDLGAVGRALWRKKWWVLGPTALVAVFATLGVNLIAPKYKSEARILIEGRENVFLRPEADKLIERDRVDQEAVNSQVQVVLSRDLARQVVGQLKLGERPEFDPVLRGTSSIRQILMAMGLSKDPLKMSPEERVLESYYDRLAAYQVDRSRVITIEFQSADPDFAARVANTVADIYLMMQQTAKLDQTRIASKWLAGEIEVLRQRVAEAENRVEEFRSKYNLYVGSNNTPLSNQQLTDLNTQIALARSQKADAEAKARLIRDMLRSGKPIEFSDAINSELIRRMTEQLATLRAQLAEQSSTLLPGHPRIKELRAQIADLERQIRREAERLVRTLENDATIAGARVESLIANLEQLKRQASSSNEQEVQLRALEREAKSQRDLLEAYLAKYREATARDSLGVLPAEARIISRAVVSNTPAFPKKLPIVMVAVLATLVLASALIAAAELFSGRVPRTVLATGQRTFGPSIGPAGLPPTATPTDFAPANWKPNHPEMGRDDAPGTGVESPATVPAVDAAAPLPGSLDEVVAMVRGGEAARCLAVVGAARGLGTTATAVALARRLAQDSRVVLVDFAFDAPAVAELSVDPVAPGITDLVHGQASFRHIITRDRASRLHLIAAGQKGEDAASILGAERVAIAINALTRTYDYLVIDGGALPQAPVERLAAFAPWAVLVTAGASEETAAAAHERLAAAGFAGASTITTLPAPELAAANAAA